MSTVPSCPICTSLETTVTFHYDHPPEIETKFPIPIDKYERSFLTCKSCNHMFSVHQIDLNNFYENNYATHTYGGIAGIKAAFDKIINLEESKSDNIGRCNNLDSYIKDFFNLKNRNEINILDIGSGTGVFPWEMHKRGYNITALDPDAMHIEHISGNIKTNTIHADFFKLEPNIRYEVITLNKVLEHVANPIHMLEKVSLHLSDKSFVYIEVPDGEAAKKLGSEREEFLIEHYHAFSIASVALLALRAGLKSNRIERLQEPSTKFTIRAILSKRETSICP